MKITAEPKKTTTTEDPLLPLAQALAKKPGETLRVRDLPRSFCAGIPSTKALAEALEKILGDRWTVKAEVGDNARTPQSYLVTATYYDAKAAGGIPEDLR